MSTTILRFRRGKSAKPQWGVVRDGRLVFPVSGSYATLAEFLAKGAAKARKLSTKGKGLEVERLEILSPITEDAQLVCQGKNYAEHIRETGFRPEEKTYNLLFMKASSSLSGARGIVERPTGVRLLDYEIELGLVLGAPPVPDAKTGQVDPAKCVTALVCMNDISARDIQIPQGQWFKGKSYATFCPAGPFLVLLDRKDFARIPELELILRVNGEVRQKATVTQMIYNPAETLTELAGLMHLKAGDVVLTGTPSGVALQAPGGWRKKLAQLFLNETQLMQKFVQLQLESGRYLKDGDVIHATITTPDRALDLGMQELSVQPATVRH